MSCARKKISSQCYNPYLVNEVETWSNCLQKVLYLLLCTMFLPHHCQTTWMCLDTKFQTHIELWTKLMLHVVQSSCLEKKY